MTNGLRLSTNRSCCMTNTSETIFGFSIIAPHEQPCLLQGITIGGGSTQICKHRNTKEGRF